MRREFKSKIQSFADLLNYAALIEEGVCLLKDGSLMAGFAYRGRDLDAAELSDLERLSARVNQSLCQLGDGWMMQTSLLRVPSQGYTSPHDNHFNQAVAQLIDDERRAQYESEDAHFESRYFMVFTYQTPTETEAHLRSWIMQGENNPTISANKIVQYFQSTLEQIENGLSNEVLLQRLGSQQLLTWCHTAITGLTDLAPKKRTPNLSDLLRFKICRAHIA